MIFILVCAPSIMLAQIVSEGFETAIPDGGGTNLGDCSCLTVPDQFSDGTNDYYGRQNNSTISANATNDYSGFSGSWYFAGEDHDASDCNSPCSATLCFTMDNLSVPNPTQNRLYEVSLLIGGNNLNNSYDPGVDFLQISYSIDDQINWTPLLCFAPTAASAGGFDLTEDSDCVEPGDGINTLNGAMTTYVGTFGAISPMNDRIHLEVCASMSQGNEEWAVDDIVISDIGFLPVEWGVFTAKPGRSGVELQWETIQEENNAGFQIERSANGQRWQNIGWVPGHFSSEQANSYKFLDKKPLFGQSYYRLRQVDQDGAYTLSTIVRIDRNTVTSGLSVYPNPAHDLIQYSINGITDFHYIELVNTHGQVVFSSRQANGHVSVANLSPGVYWVIAKSQQKQWQTMIVKY